MRAGHTGGKRTKTGRDPELDTFLQNKSRSRRETGGNSKTWKRQRTTQRERQQWARQNCDCGDDITIFKYVKLRAVFSA